MGKALVDDALARRGALAELPSVIVRYVLLLCARDSVVVLGETHRLPKLQGTGLRVKLKLQLAACLRIFRRS